MAGVKQTCGEFVNEFLNKLNKVTEDVAILAGALKSSIGELGTGSKQHFFIGGQSIESQGART